MATEKQQQALDRLLNAVETAESMSYGAGSSDTDGVLSDDRAEAIEAYHGKNRFPAPEGMSQVVSRDLFESVEWIIPSLTRIFAGSDEVVKLEPIGPEDVEAAEQETMVLNHIVTQETNWEQVFHDWAWDALVTKNAYCLAYYEKLESVEYENYENQSEEQIALLLEDEVDVLEHEAYPDTEAQKDLDTQHQQALSQWQQADAQWQAMAGPAMAQGQPLSPPPAQPQPQQAPPLHSIKIRKTGDNSKVCLRVLPPERCKIHKATPDYTLKDCDFFEFWEEPTISKLRSMGFDVDDDVSDTGSDETQEDQARDRFNEDSSRSESWDASMRKVRARMVWIRHDFDEDGIAELQYCIIVGRNVLHREECNRIPVASIVATPVPHRHIGLSLWDALKDIEDTKMQMLRQGIDNLFHANNPGTFINEDKINLDDALVSRPGRVVRGLQGQNAVYGHDISPIVIPNIFPQAVQGLEYMDQVKQGRVGVNNYFTGTDENALNRTASGVSQLTSSAAQRVEQIGRMMAPSVAYAFDCVRELLLKHGHKKKTIMIRNKWVPVNPSEWRKKRDLKISVGLGSGSKEGLIAQLMTIFQMQMQTFPLGIVDPEKVYNTAAELTKAIGFPSESVFFKQPGPPQPPPPTPEQIKAQADAQQNQAKLQAEQQKFAAQAHLDQQKMASEAAEREKDRQAELERARMSEATKLAIAELQANSAAQQTESGQNFEAQKMVAGFEREDSKTQAVEQKVQEKDDGMSELVSNFQQAIGIMTQLADRMSKPKQVIRGPDGKVIGVQ